MTAQLLPNSSLTAGYLDGEAGWGAGMNRNLRVLDALVNLRAKDKDAATPPLAVAGDVFIVGAAPTGAWAGKALQVAIWCVGDDLPNGEWAFVVPRLGLEAFVLDEQTTYRFDGAAWQISSGSYASFTKAFGDGSAASFEIAHNLGTRNVHVSVYRNAVPYDEVIVDVQRTNNSTITLTGFSTPPSLNQYIVHVSK